MRARLATRVVYQVAEARCVKVRSVQVEDDQRFLLEILVTVDYGAEFRVKRLVVKLHDAVRANQDGIASTRCVNTIVSSCCCFIFLMSDLRHVVLPEPRGPYTPTERPGKMLSTIGMVELFCGLVQATS